MKKILSVILACCTIIGFSLNNMTSVYANTKSHIATVCYRQSANTYACSYDIEPDKPVVD